MFVYRISKKVHINDLSGIGAGLHGGRWNPKGVNMVYTSSSIALASLEYLVHNYHLLSTTHICLAKIKLAKTTSMIEYQSKNLPKNWNLQMEQQFATQRIGEKVFLQGNEYILKVPSSIVPGEHNLLLNPLHVHHVKTKVIEVIDPFVFDQRLLELG
ncbi:MAG: RES family NAD+ phosphorylase [Cyclobacteriaceae bacterium]|nr:RES family NAD+ phosphorylase [Cyclobacteriaceae bacterium]